MIKAANLSHSLRTHAGRAMQALSSVRMIGTAATMGYCAVHLATTHKFSPMAFGTAVTFGAIAAVTAALLSGCWSTSRSP